MKPQSRDMQIIADVIGDDAATKLMVELGGMYLYIPKPSSEEIIAQLRANGGDAKEVAVRLKVSLSRVYKLLKEIREEREDKRQMSIFDVPGVEN